MPWYKVPLAVYLLAGSPEEAQDRALSLMRPAERPDGPLPSAQYPVELSRDQVDAHLRMREVLDQAKRDHDEGLLVSDGRFPGVRFTPGAAAALAALEFEEQQGE
jgi:hypothetical protein